MSALPDPIAALEWDGGYSNIPDGADEPERFTITDDAAATWAMRKLSALRKREAEIDAIAAQEIERITAWRNAQTESLARDVNFFTGLLTMYARIERDEHGRKSINLPHGIIKSRAGGRRVDVVDADAFIGWAEKNAPTLIRVRREPDKAAIKATFAAEQDVVVDPGTGEVVPGVAVTMSDTTYTIETN